MRKKQEETVEVDFDEFMEEHEFETIPDDRKRFKLIKGLTGFLMCCLLIGGLASTIPLIALSGGAFAAKPAVDLWNNLPSDLPAISIAQRNTIYDKNGGVIAQIWDENRVNLTNLNQINTLTINSLIDTEDKRFYSTGGFDPIGTLRAAASGSGGGSGITQQLVKNLQYYNLLGKDDKKKAVETSLSRKLKELKLSLNYSKTHTKDEILLNYFNTVAFGGPSVYGIQTASKYFFNKNAKDLDLAEAAALVGSANNPVIYNLDDPANTAWKKRQLVVLDSLVANGHITAEQARDAKNEKLTLVRKQSGLGTCASSKYPFYCQYVLNYLTNWGRLGATVEDRQALLAKGGLQIHTYLDPKMTDTIEYYLKQNWGTSNRVVAPTVIVQPGTGGVMAIGSNRDYGVGKGKTEILLPNTPAAAGSTYKIMTLSAALNSGMTEQQLNFGSYSCPLIPGPNYDSPPGGFKNSDSCAKQGGVFDYKHATAYSSNTWFITLEMKVGVNAVKEFSKKVGLAAPNSIGPRSLAYTLGPVENSPIKMAAAFATFSNDGIYCKPTPITSITYENGDSPGVPDNYNPADDACKSVISPKNAGIVLKAMKANVSGEIKDAFGVKANIPGYDTAGKSGTNQLTNSIWVQNSAKFVIFTDVYDMTNPSRGIDGAVFKGLSRPWHYNTAMYTGSELMKQLLAGTKNVGMDYNNPDNTIQPTLVDQSDFFVVPSVLGMQPQQALDIMKSAGIDCFVSKETKATPQGYSSGTIVNQSLQAGTRLAKGSQKQVILYLGK